MPRLDVYTKVHKGQRAWIAHCLVAAGKTDPQAALSLAAEVERLLQHLAAHADHEERFIHPVLREAQPDLADELEQQHAALDPLFTSLAMAASQADVPALYRALARLAGAYFQHLEAEETRAMPALVAQFDDDALIARILKPFAASMTSEDIVRDLRMQLAAVNAAESRELLTAYTRG